MKEHPILFNTEMVRALLDGRKTQTRRIVKPQPEYRENESVPGHYGTFFHGWNLDHSAVTIEDIIKYCPYGQIGDRLWVRETWQSNEEKTKFIYKADYAGNGGFVCGEDILLGWRPSIFMPKKACRLFLEIVDIRVERVMDITEEDSLAEGVQPGKSMSMGHIHTGKEHFWGLWDSINKKRGFGWNINPWVWVVEFKRI